MKVLKYIFAGILFMTLCYACGTPSLKSNANTKEQPVVIKNDSLAYEIIIFDIGFNNYLNTIARPVGYYSESYLETRNRLYVPIWNLRANNPFNYDDTIYENIIDYSPTINYGYDVNYKLFNYFEFAQRKYRMVLQ